MPADLPQDSDDFEPSMDAITDDASDEFMEEESVHQSSKKVLCSNNPDIDFLTGSYSYLFVFLWQILK